MCFDGTKRLLQSCVGVASSAASEAAPGMERQRLKRCQLGFIFNQPRAKRLRKKAEEVSDKIMKQVHEEILEAQTRLLREAHEADVRLRAEHKEAELRLRLELQEAEQRMTRTLQHVQERERRLAELIEDAVESRLARVTQNEAHLLFRRRYVGGAETDTWPAAVRPENSIRAFDHLLYAARFPKDILAKRTVCRKFAVLLLAKAREAGMLPEQSPDGRYTWTEAHLGIMLAAFQAAVA